jgi:hypothetical protein
VIKGPRTKLKNPIGISIDFANRELWVASFGNYMGTVYPIDANGDAPPLRTIRAAPEGQLALGIGNPGAVAFDPSRQEILVPN